MSIRIAHEQAFLEAEIGFGKRNRRCRGNELVIICRAQALIGFIHITHDNRDALKPFAIATPVHRNGAPFRHEIKRIRHGLNDTLIICVLSVVAARVRRIQSKNLSR